jgi:hypothetical protein
LYNANPTKIDINKKAEKTEEHLYKDAYGLMTALCRRMLMEAQNHFAECLC